LEARSTRVDPGRVDRRERRRRSAIDRNRPISGAASDSIRSQTNGGQKGSSAVADTTGKTPIWSVNAIERWAATRMPASAARTRPAAATSNGDATSSASQP